MRGATLTGLQTSKQDYFVVFLYFKSSLKWDVSLKAVDQIRFIFLLENRVVRNTLEEIKDFIYKESKVPKYYLLYTILWLVMSDISRTII